MFKRKRFYGAVSKNNNKKNSKLSLVIFVIVMLFVGAQLAQAIWREYQINKEINSLKEEISKYDKENNDLEKMLDYYNTLSYKEKEARLKLNLQKPGEKAILVGPIEEDNIEIEIKKEIGNASNGGTNIKKWWNYFFGEKK